MKEFSIFFIWFLNLLLLESSCAADSSVVNPCCSYPCQNGVCERFGPESYRCDCTNSGYYGDSCEIQELWIRFRLSTKPRRPILHYIMTHFQWFWDVVNSCFLRNAIMYLILTIRDEIIPSPPIYNTKYGYVNMESLHNISSTRLLPPIPEDCPLPMGTKGKPQLPDPGVLTERFFRRKTFRPDPQGSNLMFAFMAQHYTNQFFKTDHSVQGVFTKALGHGVDAGNIYGDNLVRQHHLRLHEDGKLKYQTVNGDVYPPTVAEVPVHMLYPERVLPEDRLAIGHEMFGLLPGLSMYATVWLREHNRVCDILKAEHPTWDDEQLFQTSRLIIIGEIINIIIEEYMQHLTGYLVNLKFDPTLLFKTRFAYSNRIALEFAHLSHWHPMMPDSFLIDGDDIPYSQFMSNTSLLMHYGVEKLVEAFSHQPAGQIGGGHNSHAEALKASEMVIRESRAMRMRPLNEYRKRFKLKPYTSFYELTGDVEMARGLEELYGDIDAVEFYPGLLLENTLPTSLFGESMLEMGASFSLIGLMGNPICSSQYWKPSTFGGETGFNIVKTSTLKKLVCLNTKWCPYVDFHVPRNEDETNPGKPSTEL
ncbi:prostaglandin G/H synthase 1-like [Pseudoliparis swirei]|uniref:prostaglandin G/H synthase 1-like n=1 Tax=Pseudoliparis swirei TaxID=2059687 RepID=UPI0024BDC442|nr:prostaglandin G/H synthase 1-like [Pseudoliparis swirei]